MRAGLRKELTSFDGEGGGVAQEFSASPPKAKRQLRETQVVACHEANCAE